MNLYLMIYNKQKKNGCKLYFYNLQLFSQKVYEAACLTLFF